MTTAGQLALPLQLNEARTLDNYVPGPNEEAVAQIRALCASDRLAEPGAGSGLFLWGAESTGRSHLLQALCHGRAALGDTVMYLPLREREGLEPAMLEGCATLDLVCLDDLHAICGLPEWERAVFRLFNELRERGRLLVMTASSNPRHLPCRLPDLGSRLAWEVVLQLQPLSESECREALCRRARARGMSLDDDTAGYLLRHWRRDLKALFDLLEHLDMASLQAQRRVTKAFVSEVLRSLSPPRATVSN